MRKPYLIILFFFILFHGFVIFGMETGKDAGNRNKETDYIVGRIGFLHSFVSDEPEVDGEVTIGVESYGETFYKLCSSDGESVVKGGLLNEGLNIIRFPVELITGENKGVFFLFTKYGEHITGKQIVLLTDRIEIIDSDTEIRNSGVVSDRYNHEITVTGEDNRFNDYASRIVMDSVSGNYPGLNQGIPILPVLFILANRIFRSIKKNKRGPVPLYSETGMYIKQRKDKSKYSLINLRILISEM